MSSHLPPHFLFFLFFLFLVSTIITTARAEIRYNDIRSDDRPIIPFYKFGFTTVAVSSSNVSSISFSSNTDLSRLGFFLCTAGSWLQVLQQIEDAEINCSLESHFIKLITTFQSSQSGGAISQLYTVSDADEFTLAFANCIPQLKVSMNVRSSMYNLDGSSNRRDYLSASETILPRVYFLFSTLHFALSAVWIYVLYKKIRLTIFRVHFFMLAVVLLKALTLLCEAEDKSYIQRTGSAHGWDVFFYTFSFLKRIMLFTLIVLIGTGWSFLKEKPYLQDKEKKVLIIVILLQVVANIAQVVIDKTGPYEHDSSTWKQVYLLVDVVSCFAVLLPIIWSIRKLREAAKADGKAAVNSTKLTLFRQYYVVFICYIYFTRVVVYVLDTLTSYRYAWTSVVAAELATLAFYVFIGLKFKPEVHNPYSVIDDEEEEADCHRAVEARR